MSANARKSRIRGATLRARAANSLAAWDDTMLLGTNSVFVPNEGTALNHLDWCEDLGLRPLEYQFLDGGVLISFPRKRDADLFRRSLIE